MIKTSKKMVSAMHRAIKEYNMLKDGDKIAVGLSGGKDSLTLLACLAQYKKQVPFNFEIVAIFIDIQGNSNTTELQNFCTELGVEFFAIKTDIKEIVFEIRKEKNPCSLCANLRRGNLNSKAVELGCNKVALGHHADDFIQTFFMSISKENRLSSFWPLSYLSKTNLYVIRPMLYVWEHDIIPNSQNYPVLESCCPANKNTERENAKKILEDLDEKIPNFKKNLLASLCETSRYNLFDKSKNLIKK